MAIIKKKIEDLKPGKNYLITVRAKNSDLNAFSEAADSIKISIPKDPTIPEYPNNLQLYASFEQVMFVFDPAPDIDISYYEYELYEASQITGSYPNYTISGSPVVSGQSASNVFTVSVQNSSKNDAGAITSVSYKGRVKSVDTSLNKSFWSPIVTTNQSTPLIDSQYINSLTASKITAGTISSAEIIMSGANSIIKSSTFNGTAVGDGSYTGATQGWLINGTGKSYFYDATIVGSIDIGGFDSGSFHVDTAGNMWLGAGTYAAAPFKVSSAGAVTSISGLIGGFSISTDKLVAGSGANQITLSTGTYHATNNPDEIVISVGGNLSSGFAAPFAVNSSGTMSAAVATVGPLQLDANGLTSQYFNSNNYITLNSSGDFYKNALRSGYYYLTYMLGELLQIKRTNISGVPTGSGAFFGYYSQPDDTRLILNAVSSPSYTSGSYVDLRSDGTITGSNYIQSLGYLYGQNASITGTTFTRYLNVATNGSIDFNSQVRQMINLWSTSYGIGVQNSTQYFRSGSRFSWYTNGLHSDTENDPGTGGTRLLTLTSGSLRLYSGQFEYYDGTYVRSRLNFNSLLFFSVTGAQKSEYAVGGFYVDSGYVAGNFSVSGTKSFRIQHPIFENKMLVHASLEGPTADVFYKGKSKLINGQIEISLPDYFEPLTEENERIAIVTPIIKNNDGTSVALGATEIKNGKFKVYQLDGSSNSNQEFYWLVQATRKNVEMEVEPDKNEYDLRS